MLAWQEDITGIGRVLVGRKRKAIIGMIQKTVNTRMCLFVGKTHGYEKNRGKADRNQSDQNNFSEHTQSLCIAVIFMRD